MPNADPLARLVVDQEEVDRALLATVLEPYVVLDPNRKSFAFRRGARESLTNVHITLVALLATKALVLVGAQMPERLSPSELVNVTGIKGNSLRPLLKRLSDQGITRRGDEGAYFIPDYQLADVAQLVPHS